MGQKVNPHGLRVGIIKDWDSNWYADKRNDEFAKNLAEDQVLRKYLKTTLYKSNISRAEQESRRLRLTHRSLQIRSFSSTLRRSRSQMLMLSS